MGRPARDAAVDWSTVPLGKVPDRSLAARLGVTRQAVGFQRRKRGLARCQRPARRRITELQRAVLCVVQRHRFPISTTQVWQEVLDEYGSVCLRTVQRALARLRMLARHAVVSTTRGRYHAA